MNLILSWALGIDHLLLIIIIIIALHVQRKSGHYRKAAEEKLAYLSALEPPSALYCLGVSSLPVLSAHHGYKEMSFRPFILECDRHTSIFTES